MKKFINSIIEMPLYWKLILVSLLGLGLGSTVVFIDVMTK